MTTRYCSHCRAEVEDAGGYCLLGHPLRLEAPVDSLGALRAEVDKAFEEARIQVTTAVALVPEAVSAPTQSAVPDAPPAPKGPPPPPAPPRPNPFSTLGDETKPNGHDPMAEFAPAPRMDWGPERHRLLRRKP